MVAGGKTQFDIIIVGGGMVGASLAVALSPLPLSVALVEAFAPDSQAQPSYDERCTAIAHGSQVILQTIGAWSGMAADACAITGIHVSDRGRPGIARITAHQQGLDALGYVVPNRAIGRALWQCLQGQPGLGTFMPAKVVAMQEAHEALALQLELPGGEQRTLSGRLVVAVDGARSALREMAGIGAATHDYRQTAIICNLTPSQPHQGWAYERFTEGGPLALLPLDRERCSVVWSVHGDQADRYMAMDEPAFAEAMQDQFGQRLGKFLRVGQRNAYPLYQVRALTQAGHRLVLLGNAAHSLHPVAGQGFNLSLRDVAALAEVLAGPDAADPGAQGVLDQYLAWRLDDQDRVLGFTDALVRLFTNPFAPVRMARSAGLLSFDLLPGLKRAFARHTMGRAGRLPRLARGVPLA